MHDTRFRHPLTWWQFYVACLRHAGSGVLGVIGDASTILGALVFGVKLAAPGWYTAGAAFLKASGRNEDLLIGIPLTIGCAILLLRFVAAPFAVYKDQVFTLAYAPNGTVSRPRVKLSAGLVNVSRDPSRGEWLSKFTITNYGETVALNVSANITIPDTNRSLFFEFSELRRDEPQQFMPKLYYEGNSWYTSEWPPLDVFLKDARLEAFISRQFAAADRMQKDEGAEEVLQAQRDGYAVQISAATDIPIGPELRVRFDVTYTDISDSRLMYRTPHVLVYRPLGKLHPYADFESPVRIDLIDEPEPSPTPAAGAVARVS